MTIPFDRDELKFLVQHDIDPESVFDARNMTGRTFKVAAKEIGADFVYTSPCQKAGHRLKTRSSGTCIQCNTAVIAYQKRNAAKSEGFVYVAKSDTLGLIKIGCCWPNLDKRILNLRSQSYGGVRDWKLLFDVKVNAMGLCEVAVHKRLAKYAVQGDYYKEDQVSSELFNCTIDIAVKAVKAEGDVYCNL